MYRVTLIRQDANLPPLVELPPEPISIAPEPIWVAPSIEFKSSSDLTRDEINKEKNFTTQINSQTSSASAPSTSLLPPPPSSPLLSSSSSSHSQPLQKPLNSSDTINTSAATTITTSTSTSTKNIIHNLIGDTDSFDISSPETEEYSNSDWEKELQAELKDHIEDTGKL